jgi:exodeoxyribonuclease VII large subunit
MMVYTELFPALMQGDRVEESVLSALDKINSRSDSFDVVVIIRGGGATSDLSGFDTYLLAAACAQFPLPVITGIGHERDDTVLDSVAHTRVKTPTAAAEFLIDCMNEAADELESLAARLCDGVRNLLVQEQQKLVSYRNRIPSAAYGCISDAKLTLLTKRHCTSCNSLLVSSASSAGVTATTAGGCFSGKAISPWLQHYIEKRKSNKECFSLK